MPLIVPIVIDNRARLEAGSLPADVLAALKNAFNHDNPKHFKLRSMGYRAVDEPPKVKTWEMDRGVLSLPRGGFGRVRGILREAGIGWRIDDQRTEGDKRWRGKVPDYQGYELRGYQNDGVEQILLKQNCLIRAGTGSGKTTIAFAAAARIKLPTLVVVWSAALFEQWIRRCQFELKMREEDVGVWRGGVHRFGAVTVAMQQSLWKRITPELRMWPGFLVVDEVNRAASKTLQWCVDQFPAKFRLGVSDNEKRSDGKEFLTYDQFANVALEVPFDELADAGHVIDVEVRVVPTDFEAPREYYETRDFNVLLDAMTTNVDRNKLIVNIAAHEGKKEQLLVMSHRVAHCQELDRLIAARGVTSGLLLGTPEWEATFHRTREQLESGKIRCGVGTLQNVGTGVDLPTLGVCIATTPIASNENVFRQARGRACRVAKGKKDARIYVLWDRLVHPHHLASLKKWSRRVVVLEGTLSQGKWLLADEWQKRHKSGQW